MDNKERILQVNGLITRFYSVDGVVHALNNVAFDLEEGETIGVVGESGSGKSVTMMSLLGLIPKPPGKIEGGTALFASSSGTIDLLQLSERELRDVRGGQIGFIFQDPISSLNPVMTIGNQIAESMITHFNIDVSVARKRTIVLLDQVGIPDATQRFGSYPHEFSGGMRQRVMIAIAMACEPKIVIADEPTTALDVTVQAQIVELIQRLQRNFGTAVVWISHDLGVVAGLADRVLVMYGGTVVENALVDDLYEQPQHPYTIGLLGAIPDIESETRLVSIDGSPPDLLQPLAFCPFASRCTYAFDRCWQELPTPIEHANNHFVACFYDMAKGQPRK
ncbi:MAG: ABC transporter ATP-binding protein [Chloroflexi bacterium]|nr:ABC transporter ATP-binding protein [Chloroflexota bacterium]